MFSKMNFSKTKGHLPTFRLYCTFTLSECFCFPSFFVLRAWRGLGWGKKQLTYLWTFLSGRQPGTHPYCSTQKGNVSVPAPEIGACWRSLAAGFVCLLICLLGVCASVSFTRCEKAAALLGFVVVVSLLLEATETLS